MITIISLVGEQPIPNLLPFRYLQPEVGVLVHSDFTRRSAEQLEKMISPQMEVIKLEVDAYQVNRIRDDLVNVLADQGLNGQQVIVNLTGGTKPMSLAAFLVAKSACADVIYLQTEGKRTRLFFYKFSDEDMVLEKDEILPGIITADDYLRAFVDRYAVAGFSSSEPGGSFEQAIYHVLFPVVHEILAGVKLLGALDLDFVVRCENQVGIIEAKMGHNKLKMAIDQLNTAAGQRFLGTYTQKFLVSDQRWDSSLSNLKELAEARRICLIEIPDYDLQTGTIPQTSADRLRRIICKELGRNI